MNVLILNNYKIFEYINNIKSDSLGFYFSFFLHLVFFVFIIGVPNVFERSPITLPNVIPIEIVNITDTTTIPKIIPKNLEQKKEKKISESVSEFKKFNNFDNQEIKKMEIKTKPDVEIKKNENVKIAKEDVIIKEKTKTPIKLEKEKKALIDTKIENLPTKKIVPKLKPKPESQIVIDERKIDVLTKAIPIQKPKKEYNIATMLKDLRNEQSSQKKNLIKDKVKKENVSEVKEEISAENIQLSISEIDLLRQQLSSCWIAPAGAVIKKGMVVKISAKLQKNRRVYDNSIRIVDTNISKSNPFYEPITESAMRTLLNPDCIPLKLPENKYSLWKNLTITFDYSIMKGY